MFDEKLQGLIFSLREMADDMALSPHGRGRALRIREAIELLDSFNAMHEERDQLRGALMMIAEGKCPALVPPMTPEQIARAALSGECPAHETSGELSEEAAAELQECTGKMRQRSNRFEVDIGPSGKLFIDDDDFHWDALLQVQGDFETPETKRYYAEAIAKVLSAHEAEIPYRTPHPVSPENGEPRSSEKAKGDES